MKSIGRIIFFIIVLDYFYKFLWCFYKITTELQNYNMLILWFIKSLCVPSKDAILALMNLQKEIANALNARELNEDEAIDSEYQIKKAVQCAKTAEPDKKSIIDHLKSAQIALGTATSATGLVKSIGQAIEMIQKIF